MSLRIIPQVLQSDPELRSGMMGVLMARLEDSYTRLNMVKKMKARCQYFFDFRQELRLDARNIRLCGPQPGDYKKAFADAGFQEDDVDEALYKSMNEDIENGY